MPTTLEEVFATFAKLPNGKNREKEGKIEVFDDFGYILPNGKMAKVAKSPTDTFSDKVEEVYCQKRPFTL